MRVAVCMPVYGRAELTDNVIDQLGTEADYVHTYVCDNLGDYGNDSSFVEIARPGSNLGWLRGTNHVWQLAADSGDYDAYILLNNDVVLSEGFVKRLYLAAAEAGASVAVPLYDRGFPQQIAYTGPASAFVPTKRYDPAYWMDGTCMLVTSEACDQLGYLDAEHFGRYGWGASLDYGIRARRRGLRTVVTHQAYLNHLEAVTAHAVLTDYESNAEQEREAGMRLKYGAAWRAQLTPNPAKKLMYMALQWPAARAFARSLARTRVGREIAGRIR